MVTVSALIRDEVDRWLPRCLESWQTFADRICVLDDGSEDDLAGLLETVEVPVYVKTQRIGLYRNRTAARKAQWDWSTLHTPIGEWIFVLDADMQPASDPRGWFTPDRQRVAFRTYDMWDDEHYRSDILWRQPWRTWAVRWTGKPAKWAEGSIHTSHLPENYGTGYSTPCPVPLLHWAYASPESRQRQYDKYMANADLLKGAELGHAKSILSESPNLVAL